MLLFTFDDAGTWTVALQASALILFAYLAIIWLSAVFWTANDVRHRTRSTALRVGAIGLVAFLFLPGLLLYIALRPQETLEVRMERAFEMEMFYQAARAPNCANCSRRIEADFIRCPYCSWQVGVSCTSCERIIALSWVVCAYCGSQAPPGEPRRTEMEHAPARPAARERTAAAVAAGLRPTG